MFEFAVRPRTNVLLRPFMALFGLLGSALVVNFMIEHAILPLAGWSIPAFLLLLE